LIPVIISSVLAIELYLKSPNAYSVIRNLEDYGGRLMTIPKLEAENKGRYLHLGFESNLEK
jgi:hypothetical protein